MTARVLKACVWVLFLLYLLVLFQYLVMDRYQYTRMRSYNLIPFDSIRSYIEHKESYNYRTWWMNLFGNLVMLVPFGVLLPLVIAKLRKTWAFVVALLAFNLGIEIMQFGFRLGSFDVDDLLLNSSGALIAYAFIRVVLTVARKPST
ncbi:VanZ family protein [Cohnella sp. GCM10027633]|uniref:VanZ family protein n=1 Tax=unclassified Cohnella TaxID=2636738 RepID=UPI00362652EF